VIPWRRLCSIGVSNSNRERQFFDKGLRGVKATLSEEKIPNR